jgi:hypothetical protein
MRRRRAGYFVVDELLLLPLVLGLVALLPLGLVVLLEPLLDGEVVDGEVVDGEVVDEEPEVLLPGDADGVPVSLRLQAPAVPASSARAQSPDSNFFISRSSLWGVGHDRRLQPLCPLTRVDLTGCYTFLTTANYP